MSRPIRGDIRVIQVRQKKANNVTYVYERTVKYNPQTRNNDVLSSKLIGKITPDSNGEIIPTKFRAKPQPKNMNMETISRHHMGMMSLLDWVGAASGIDEDLRAVMPEDSCGVLADRICAIAKFWLATGGDPLPNLYTWQVKHGIAEDRMISEDIYHDVFQELGMHEQYIQEYFKARVNRLAPDDSIAYDSTTVSTYSENLTQARYGFNKDQDGLPTIKLLTLYSLDTEQPFAYWEQPGNIPDAVCVENALKQLDYLDISKPTVVTDNGFCTMANIVSYIRLHVKFVCRITRNDARWVKDCLDKHLSELGDINNVIDFDHDISGLCVTVRPQLSFTARYSTSQKSKGESVRITPRLYLGIFRSHSRCYEEERVFTRDLYELKALIEEGKEEQLSDAALKRAHKYLAWSCSRQGRIKVSFNTEAVEDAKKYMGIFCLCSNRINQATELLRLGRKREHIEDMFRLLKQKADGNKPRVHDTDRLRGRQFVQFVALGYYDYLYKKLKDLKAVLGKPNGDVRHDLKENLKEEDKLLKWLKNSSLNEILQWFDAVDLVRLTGKKHRHIKLITETTKRDRLFLEKIGYYGPLGGNHQA